jgi:hypothetical protein
VYLVAKGFLQESDIDFNEIFSPVLKMITLRFVFDIVVIDDLRQIFQLDVKMSFLHSDLDEEIEMEQAQGFVSPGCEHLLYRLLKSLIEASSTTMV